MTIPDLPARGPVDFTIDGHRYTLPTIPTRDWLDALILQPPTSWMQLLPTHLPTEQQWHLHERLHDPHDPFDIDHLEKNALTVLGTVLGIDFHAAQRLVVYARSNWMEFDAYCAERGLDPLETHISRVCNLAYGIRLQSCEKDSERFQVKSKVFAPPEGARASGRAWTDDPDYTATWDQMESDAFMAALSLSR